MSKIMRLISKVAEAIREFSDDERGKLPAHRIPLPMKSTDKERKPLHIKAGSIVTVAAQPQVLAMRVERIVIEVRPEDWIVHDIRVGNRSQLAQAGTILGASFGPERDVGLSLEVCQTAMHFEMLVEYVGASVTEGRVFEATAYGMATLS